MQSINQFISQNNPLYMVGNTINCDHSWACLLLLAHLGRGDHLDNVLAWPWPCCGHLIHACDQLQTRNLHVCTFPSWYFFACLMNGYSFYFCTARVCLDVPGTLQARAPCSVETAICQVCPKVPHRDIPVQQRWHWSHWLHPGTLASFQCTLRQNMQHQRF